MTDPYPLCMEPFYRDYLWGGRNLQLALGKQLPTQGVWAESWEIVDRPEHSSLVSNGEFAGKSLRQLFESDSAWLFGSSDPQSLPLLLKYLDCNRVLSVQVHPDDQQARALQPPDLGKTEAWYIVSAEPGAVLYAGLKPGVRPNDLRAAVESGTVESCLHVIQPQAGDCIFIPAGTVHALGAGLLVAEIQQASNTTFRLFDWNRVDDSGQPRTLHIEQALDVIDFAGGPRSAQKGQQTPQPARERLVHCDKFVLDRILSRNGQRITAPLAGDDRAHLLTMPTGQATLSWQTGGQSGKREQQPLATGQSVLIPAAMPTLEVHLEGESVLLDMYVP